MQEVQVKVHCSSWSRVASHIGICLIIKMKLITLNEQNIICVEYNDITVKYKDVFVGEGKLEGKLHLVVDETVTSIKLPVRKVPIAVKDKLKNELEGLQN